MGFSEESDAAPWWLSLARPKSRSFACPRGVTNTFAGFRSRWTTPLPCAASSASAIWMPRSSSGRELASAARRSSRAASALEQLHRDEPLPLVRVDVVDGADAGVVEGRGSVRLALEALERLGLRGEALGQELEGHGTPEPGVLGLVDDPHPAAAQLLDDAIVRERLADHA